MSITPINSNKKVELSTLNGPEVGKVVTFQKGDPLSNNSTISSLGSRFLPTDAEKRAWKVEKGALEAELVWREKEFDSWPWWKQALLGIGFGVTKLMLLDQIRTLANLIEQPTVEELTAERDALKAERQKLIDEFMAGKEDKFEQYREEFEKGGYTSKTGSSMSKDFFLDGLKMVLTKIGPIEMQIQRINNQLRTGLPPETIPGWTRPL